MTENATDKRTIDELFDEGVDMTPFMVKGTGRHPRLGESRKVCLSLPVWLIEELDAQAEYLTIPRQSVIIVWLAEKAKEAKKERSA